MTMPTDVAEAQNLQTSNATISTVAGLGLTVPPEWDVLNRQRHALAPLIAGSLPPLPELPADPSKMEAVLRKAATERATALALVDVAKEASAGIARAQVVLVRAEMAAWIDALCEQFAKTAEQFQASAALAPVELSSGDEPPEQVEAFLAQRRTVAELDRLGAARLALGQSVGEEACHWSTLWLYVDVPSTGDIDDPEVRASVAVRLAAGLQAHRAPMADRQPAFQKWQRIAAVGELSMAPLGQVAARGFKFDRLRGSFATGAGPHTVQGKADIAERAAYEEQTMALAVARGRAERDQVEAETRRVRALDLA